MGPDPDFLELARYHSVKVTSRDAEDEFGDRVNK